MRSFLSSMMLLFLVISCAQHPVYVENIAKLVEQDYPSWDVKYNVHLNHFISYEAMSQGRRSYIFRLDFVSGAKLEEKEALDLFYAIKKDLYDQLSHHPAVTMTLEDKKSFLIQDVEVNLKFLNLNTGNLYPLPYVHFIHSDGNRVRVSYDHGNEDSFTWDEIVNKRTLSQLKTKE